MNDVGTGVPWSGTNGLAGHDGGADGWSFFAIEPTEEHVGIITGDTPGTLEVTILCSETEGWGVAMSPAKARELAAWLNSVADLAESGAIGPGGNG